MAEPEAPLADETAARAQVVGLLRDRILLADDGADLLLVEGDPTEDVAIFSNWETGIDLVMKDGVIYRNELGE